MYHYSNYDAWRTENPWYGQARMSGFADFDDQFTHDSDDDPNIDFDDLVDHGATRLRIH